VKLDLGSTAAVNLPTDERLKQFASANNPQMVTLYCGAGGWTSQHLWEHYLYNGDKAFLASVYPILKEAATFYVDFLIEHPTKKWLVINPDMSPENAPAAHQNSSPDAGTTMTNQIVFDIFSSTIKATEILKKMLLLPIL